ncbi:MAG: aldehyde oxidase and xanthine dehydrogenase, molybdopterin binding [Myxococcales bacterium]|nr:aldehyde oxidase and xanthine dehydrogenase, molybdopterin binding [Myxococcales bacterium]
MKKIGPPVDRVDGPLKVTGGARYAAEVPVARVAHAVLVLSTIARGRITGMDTGKAERAPGVLAVITHKNAMHLPPQPTRETRASQGDHVLQLLQDDHVLYNRQPIAIVVADTFERAQHAAHLVAVRYEAAPVDVDLLRTRTAARAPHPPYHGTVAQTLPVESRRGDVAAALAAAAVRVEEVYTIPAETHNPMEPHATIAVWHGPTHLTVYDSTQGVFEDQRKLAASLGLPRENVRVISHYIGGGFGTKGAVWSHVPLAAMAAQKVGRPVKLVLSRPQMFGPVGARPQIEQRVVIGAGRDGVLAAIRHEGRSSVSQFDQFCEHFTAPTRALYKCPNLDTTERVVSLDIATPCQMRAPGEVTGTFALESALDELAVKLAIDPLELRLRNYAETDPETGRPWSSKSLRQCYQTAAEKFGWSRKKPQPRSMVDGKLLVGWGMATATYPANVRPASAIATLFADGTALVRAGTQDIGTGTYTVMTQVAADALGLPVEKVRFELGDTDMPETPTSGGSCTAASVGSAVHQACLGAREKLARLGNGGGADPSVDEPFAAQLARHGMKRIEARYDAKQLETRDRYAMRAFGAQFVEVRVDPELGEVRVSRAVGAFAAGRILNAKTARSQLLGGMIWGISMALHENTVYDPKLGRIMNNDLSEYLVPVNLDIPAIDVLFVPEDDPYVNEIGVKGVGEIGITGMAAAVANAVYHATGRRIRDLPITLDKLL